ncbi:MAG TPA: penicillin-binding transpeptidase domain-containing protein [Jatrophihabitans sp.]
MVGGIAGCTKSKKTPPEQISAQAFLAAFGSGDVTGASQRTSAPSAAAATMKASLTGLGAGAKATLTVTGLANRSSNAATANYSASWRMPGVATPWTYNGSLPMTKQGNAWQVTWGAADLYPTLPDGTHLAVKRSQPARAALTDAAGKPLFTATPVVRIGIEKALVTDLASLAATLAALPVLQTSAKQITDAVTAANPKDFVDIITLRKTVYEQIKPQIYNLHGTVFQDDTLLLPPTSHFGEPLLGTVGQATKQLIDSSAGRLQTGDQTGIGGLQQAFDTQLAGTPGVAVYAASDSDGSLGTRLAAVESAKAGTPVRLTLDSSVQNAADAALASTPLPASVVAVQPSTGKILAVANSTAATDDIALVGQYPAGSTFKIVTYTAAFMANPSLTASSQVACPPTVTVDGRTFQNENKFSYPPIPISAAFGYSCNTTAIATAMKLPADAMHNAATSLGLGAKWSLPIDAFSGSLPTPSSQTEQAADAIGQGKVLVSPLLMALIAGASASGTPVAPSLVDGKQATPGTALPAALTAKMNQLMKATVDLPGGTAHQLADLGNVEGKTGTAEFGTATPPKSHSWFAGTRGDLAFAVFVYGGESSHSGAVPIAHTFLSAVK